VLLPPREVGADLSGHGERRWRRAIGSAIAAGGGASCLPEEDAHSGKNRCQPIAATASQMPRTAMGIQY
jgi:hypothetical protein